jgi:hypothetical protein
MILAPMAPLTEFYYNSVLPHSYHTAHICSPFNVVYNRDPPTLVSYQQGASKMATVDKQLMAQDEFLREISDRLLQSQVTIKSYHDQKRQEVEFQEDDWVS